MWSDKVPRVQTPQRICWPFPSSSLEPSATVLALSVLGVTGITKGSVWLQPATCLHSISHMWGTIPRFNSPERV